MGCGVTEPAPIPPEYITTGCGPGLRVMGERERRAVDLRKRIQAVVDADDAIRALHDARAKGTIVHQSAWRGAYRARETADRELYGQYVDDRALFARRLLELLDDR